MGRTRASHAADIAADPFKEREGVRLHERALLLGGEFHFETDSRELLRIVRHAFGRLPAHRFSKSAPSFLVKLLLMPAPRGRSRRDANREPPPIVLGAGKAIFCGAMQSANFVAVTPGEREALIVVSEDMLRFAYHVRYEMLEFAVYTLAARAQGLLPLHAACVGVNGRGVLLLGPSGAGKSTLALHSLLQGLEFVAEDSVLVHPQTMAATGIANFLHIRSDSAGSLVGVEKAAAAVIRRSPTIQRRSGVRKAELDLRRREFQLARNPVPLAAVIMVSARNAGGRPLLSPLPQAEFLAQLSASQPYAAAQAGWSRFRKRMGRLPAFELRRGSSPLDSVEAVRQLLLTLGGATSRSPRDAK